MKNWIPSLRGNDDEYILKAWAGMTPAHYYRYILSIMALPNSEHFSSVAPSICRSRS